MPRSKSFSSLNVAMPEPLEFNLNNHVWHCQTVLPGAALLDFAAKLDKDSTADMAGAINEFFDMALVVDEKESFAAFLRDPNQRIGIDTLMEIAEWLMEQFMGEVPLAPGSPSSAG